MEEYIDDLKAYNLLHKGILALAKAEQQGLRIDVEYVEKKMQRLDKKIKSLEHEFKNSKLFRHWHHSMIGEINIHSNIQLGVYLYQIRKVKIQKQTVTGKGSTDDESLRQMNIPELELLLRIRKLKKVQETYLSSFIREQVNGYIHPFFNLHLVTTYRSSSNHPNFQNIPKRDKEAMQICRKALYPRPGHQLLEVDYSGLEVRIAACYHKDPTMLEYITNPTSDMHADMAKQIFLLKDFNKSDPLHNTLRQAAKNGFIFPEFYGDYYGNCAISMACGWGKLSQGKWNKGEGIPLNEGTLSDHLIRRGIKSLADFTEHVKKIEADFWGRRFNRYAKWKDRWYDDYKKKGYIELYTGFRCTGIMSKNDCINYPIQGSAFHCLLWSFIRLEEVLSGEKLTSRLVGQIHDSILIDVNPDELEYIAEIIHKVTCFELPEFWKWIIVPLDVDMEICPVDGSWAEKQQYKFK